MSLHLGSNKNQQPICSMNNITDYCLMNGIEWYSFIKKQQIMKTFNLLLITFIISISLTAQDPTRYGDFSGMDGDYTSSYFGYETGANSLGLGNTLIGHRSGFVNKSGTLNSFLGMYSGYNTEGSKNTSIGANSGYTNTTGSYNTYIGYSAGNNNSTGQGNVMLGHKAGYYETLSDKLYIDNSGTRAPLIYGDFKEDEVTVNGNFILPDGYINQTGNFYLGGNAETEEGMRLFGGRINNGQLSGGFIDAATDNLNEGIRFRLGLMNDKIEERMIIKADGKVRIGGSHVTTPGDYKLYVQTGILTEKVKVANVNDSDWADFVFDKDYQLNSTTEVEQFIKTNKHLPNVPSAKEVSENGVDMVEMDATLLRQIEELWLHVIELKKENEELKRKIESGK